MERYPDKGPDRDNGMWLPDATQPERLQPFEQFEPQPATREQHWNAAERRRRWIALALFIAACLSTFIAGIGSGQFQNEFYKAWGAWPEAASDWWKPLALNGLLYSLPLMAILIAHEGGHWLLARRHHVPATVPFFIPFPLSPIGTMGAVILQDGRRADRKALFDIAIAGPLAGLVLALPIAWVGVRLSEWKQVEPDLLSVSYGDPLVLKWMIRAVHGPLPEGADVMLNPLLFAGWVGVFITALNLMPIGQLDGGHILYTLIGKRAHKVSMALLFGGVALMVWFKSPSYALMAILLFFTGPRHPPTANDNMRLGPVRVILGWLTLGFILIGFTPTPIILPENKSKDEKPPVSAPATPPMTTHRKAVDDAHSMPLQVRSNPVAASSAD